MPQLSLSHLRHPFRYPEWGEMLLAIIGLLQFIFALIFFDELTIRPGFALIVYFSPEAWSVAGIILCAAHIVGLLSSNTDKGHFVRLVAVGSSLAFWSHFILSIVTNSVFFSGPFPGLLIPALGTPLLAGAVLYRLWRRY